MQRQEQENYFWKGKGVYIKTKAGLHFSGVVIEEDDISITIIDKFRIRVRLSLDEISILNEDKRRPA